MRRFALSALALLLAAPAAAPVPAVAQGLPPHAFLFGVWTGGLFPVPSGPLSPLACFAQPVVIFTKDVVMRVTLTSPFMLQREIETAAPSRAGIEMRFVGAASGGPLVGGGPALPGFGCDSADVLHVQRRGQDEITFPGCADFPNPLVRCHTR